MKKGDRVTIYHDPITETSPEGTAVLISRIDTRVIEGEDEAEMQLVPWTWTGAMSLEYWLVSFERPADTLTYDESAGECWIKMCVYGRRWIKKEKNQCAE